MQEFLKAALGVSVECYAARVRALLAFSAQLLGSLVQVVSWFPAGVDQTLHFSDKVVSGLER
jgi:hypothetical protein